MIKEKEDLLKQAVECRSIKLFKELLAYELTQETAVFKIPGEVKGMFFSLAVRSFGGDFNLVQTLLDPKHGGDIISSEFKGEMLWLSALFNNMNIVQCLLGSEQTGLPISNKDKFKALRVANDRWHTDIARFLEKDLGIKPKPNCVLLGFSLFGKKMYDVAEEDHSYLFSKKVYK